MLALFFIQPSGYASFRHAGPDPASRALKHWIPAFAGMTLFITMIDGASSTAFV
jgi:hypothetical protein